MKKSIGSLVLATLFILSCIVFPLMATAAEADAVDYTALFDKEATVDGYLAEGYYFEVNQIFHNNPEEFVTELAKRPFSQINSIAFAIATQENPSLDENLNEYKESLNSLKFLADSPEHETLYVMKLCISRLDVGATRLDPLYFEKTRHSEIKGYYNENNRLFFLCMEEIGSEIQFKYADALVYELSESELTTLDETLASNSNADWATEDIKVIIDTFRNRVDEALTPPSESEPTTTEPTTTESTTPIVPQDQPKDTPNDSLLIPILCIGAVIIIFISLKLIQKRKARDDS